MYLSATVTHPANRLVANPLKKIFDLSGEVNRVFGIITDRMDDARNFQDNEPAPDIRSRAWTPERRVRQAALLRRLQPWRKSTGPRTASGKARTSQNARKTPRALLRAAIRSNATRLRLARRIHRQYFVFLRREMRACRQLMRKKPAPPATRPAHTLNSSFARLRDELKKHGVENPAREARILLKHYVPGVTDAAFITGEDMSVTIEQYNALTVALRRRAELQEPLGRILGHAEFWSLRFRVTPDVLDPRADTETLVAAAVKNGAARPPAAILDLGTGTGCILIALLTEFPAARGMGVDFSEAALAIARENAKTNGVAARAEFLQGDWDEKLTARYDLIVSNPPYIESAVIPNLDGAVRDYDPLLALDGGADGLAAYKRIVDALPNRLTPAGCCFLEIGAGQGPAVARLIANAGLALTESYLDTGGVERVLKISLGTKL